MTHLDVLNTKIAALSEMVATLEELVTCCAGDERPECPILTGLAGTAPSQRAVLREPETRGAVADSALYKQGKS